MLDSWHDPFHTGRKQAHHLRSDRKPPEGDPEVGNFEVLFQEGTIIDHWSAAACLLCDQAWSIVLAKDDRVIKECARAAP